MRPISSPKLDTNKFGNVELYSSNQNSNQGVSPFEQSFNVSVNQYNKELTPKSFKEEDSSLSQEQITYSSMFQQRILENPGTAQVEQQASNNTAKIQNQKETQSQTKDINSNNTPLNKDENKVTENSASNQKTNPVNNNISQTNTSRQSGQTNENNVQNKINSDVNVKIENLIVDKASKNLSSLNIEQTKDLSNLYIKTNIEEISPNSEDNKSNVVVNKKSKITSKNKSAKTENHLENEIADSKSFDIADASQSKASIATKKNSEISSEKQTDDKLSDVAKKNQVHSATIKPSASKSKTDNDSAETNEFDLQNPAQSKILNSQAEKTITTNNIFEQNLTSAKSVSPSPVSNQPITFTDVQFNEIAQKATQIINNIQENTTQLARLILKPASLGTIFIEVSVNNNIAKLDLKADSKEVAKALEGQMESLRDKLHANGIKLESVNIEHKQSENSTQYQPYSQNNQSQREDKKFRKNIFQMIDRIKYADSDEDTASAENVIEQGRS